MKRKYSQEEVNKHMLGKLYINKDDSNIFVRRKKGFYSWTMNLGNKWSWIIMCAELLLIIFIVLVIL